MALIIDPDDLNQATEIVIDTSAKTISLLVAGNLSDDGVTGQALYSFLKEEWKDDATLIPYPFPLVSITPEQYEFVEGWVPLNDTTRNLVRTAGWREIDGSDTLTREYMGIVSLGSIGGSNTPYYAFSSNTSSTPFDFSGEINQAVQTFGNASNGNFDSRGDSLNVFIRSQGQTYGDSNTVAIGVTAVSYITYRFPLSESSDGKISASDATISTTAPYTGMDITYGAVTRTIGGVSYDFGVVVDGNSGTAEQIYEFVQYQLRQDADIDSGAGTENGLLAESLMGFEGDTLKTKLVSAGGVYIDNFNANDTNRLTFIDDTGTERTFPFVATGDLVFNANIQNDADAVYVMFFTSGFDSASAIIVDDNNSVDIQGTVSANASITFDFDYDNNVQGGRTAGTDADVTVVSIGADTSQYVIATGTITRSVGQTISLVAPLERNFNNPV
tara:strand:+ start:1896 stop:3227 length:1332 start_codon:yes stop_codon:yes gene_type:complete